MKPARTLAIACLSILLLFHAIVTPRGAVGQSAQAIGDHKLYLPLMLRAGTPSDGATAAEREVVRLTNQERAANGCSTALTIVPSLVTAARNHSLDMATNNFFSHTGSDGFGLGERLEEVGYSFSSAAENIAAGMSTPAAVVDAWMGSSGHRQNILNCSYTEIGVGFASNPKSDFGSYWTQVFGRR